MSHDIEKLARVIARQLAKDQKIEVGRSAHSSAVKIKLQRGPFGLFTQRVVLSQAEFVRLCEAVNLAFLKGKI